MSDEKDLGLWASAIELFRAHGLAALLAFALSYVRIIYDDEEPRTVRQLIEATLGGLIVLTVGLTCEHLGLSSGWSYFAAGFVGLVGVEQVRALARRVAERKLGRL